ncbi:MAG: leucine-rich repeat protein, partial [Firmicutes bacterium]|nr:leucine-rich repeat protein [Bacillota bacterium]
MFKRRKAFSVMLFIVYALHNSVVFAADVDKFYPGGFFISGHEITPGMISVPNEYTKAEGNGVFDDVTGYIYRHYQSKAQSYTTDYSGEVYGYWFISTTENIKKMDLSDNNYEWGKHPEYYSTLFPKGVFKDKPNMKYLYGAHNYNCIDGRGFENCAVRSVRIPQKKYYSQSVYWNNPYQGWKVSDKKIRPLNYSLIDSEAFVNCPNLTSVIIDGMETVIEDNAFVN